jgi:integrase
MMIRVEQGKGRKDRYTVLSERLLSELRTYWKEHRSPTWLFPNAKNNPLSIDYAQKIYNRAKHKAQIHKGKGIHTLRHYAESRTMPSLFSVYPVRSTFLIL